MFEPVPPEGPQRWFILYDGRAYAGMGTDDAAVLEVCYTRGDAEMSAKSHGGAACYSYEADGDGQLIDERHEFDVYPTALDPAI